MPEPDPEVPAPVDPYGATVEQVAALLPKRDLTRGQVTTDQVRAYLADLSARLVARVGPPTDWPDRRHDGTDGRRAELQAAAAGALHLGAAAYVEDALSPERASAVVTDTSYGAVLWQRHLAALADLDAALAAAYADDPDHPRSGAGRGQFPPATGWDRVAW